MRKALNHMTVPRLGYMELLGLAKALGCEGVEVRNDIGRPLFDGMSPADAGRAARDANIRIVGVSQVYPFNDWSEETETKVRELVSIAKKASAETISLIPRNDGEGRANGERQAKLRIALKGARAILDGEGILALIEPLGFQRSSLRDKSELVDVIGDLDAWDQFAIVHDTFHHTLAGGGRIYSERTGIVHISGVSNPDVPISAMEDEHRILVDENDRLGNLDQIAALMAGGYDGIFSYECFSPNTHALEDPLKALRRSFDFIERELHKHAA